MSVRQRLESTGVPVDLYGKISWILGLAPGRSQDSDFETLDIASVQALELIRPRVVLNHINTWHLFILLFLHGHVHVNVSLSLSLSLSSQ